MPQKQEIELKKDDLEAVLEDGESVVEDEQDQADFLVGFEEEENGFKQPEPDPVPETKPDETGEGDPPKDDATGDPDEGDGDGDTKPKEEDDGETPPWLKHITEMENRIATRMRNVEGHIGGLKSQLMQAKTDAADAGEDAPTNAQIKDATGKKGSTEKLDKLRTEFPEWADALDELETNLAPAASPPAQAPDTYTREQVAYMVNDSTARARELARVDAAHPGWEDTRNTPEFARWRDSQPEETQSLADSPKAADAIKMFDLYKESITTPKAPANTSNKSERLKRSVAPRTTGTAPVEHVPTEEDDFLVGFKDG